MRMAGGRRVDRAFRRDQRLRSGLRDSRRQRHRRGRAAIRAASRLLLWTVRDAMTSLHPAAAVVALFMSATIANAGPQLVFSDLNAQGAPRSFGDLRGQPTAIVVWKASCAPCLDELSYLR